MKYNIGDIVRIKKNAHRIVTNTFFNNEMRKFEGKTYVIKRAYASYTPVNYELKDVTDKNTGYSWLWNEYWLEVVEPEIVISDNEFENMFV
jgi:hypothetical protein